MFQLPSIKVCGPESFYTSTKDTLEINEENKRTLSTENLFILEDKLKEFELGQTACDTNCDIENCDSVDLTEHNSKNVSDTQNDKVSTNSLERIDDQTLTASEVWQNQNHTFIKNITNDGNDRGRHTHPKEYYENDSNGDTTIYNQEYMKSKSRPTSLALCYGREEMHDTRMSRSCESTLDYQPVTSDNHQISPDTDTEQKIINGHPPFVPLRNNFMDSVCDSQSTKQPIPYKRANSEELLSDRKQSFSSTNGIQAYKQDNNNQSKSCNLECSFVASTSNENPTQRIQQSRHRPSVKQARISLDMSDLNRQGRLVVYFRRSRSRSLSPSYRSNHPPYFSGSEDIAGYEEVKNQTAPSIHRTTVNPKTANGNLKYKL